MVPTLESSPTRNSIGGCPHRRGSCCPTYNEAANIEAIVEAVLAKLPASGRVLIVDDNSPDGTGEIAERLAARERAGRGPAAAAQGRPRPRLRRRVPPGAGVRRRPGAGDGRRLLPRPRLPAEAARGGRARRSRDRLPLRAGRRGLGLERAAAGDQPRRQRLRPPRPRARRSATSPAASSASAARSSRLIDLDSVASRGYAFQVELTYRAIQHGFEVVEVPIVFRDRRQAHRRWEARSSPRRSGVSLSFASKGISDSS